MPLETIYQTTISQSELQAIENWHRDQVTELNRLIRNAEASDHLSLVARYEAELDQHRDRLRHLDQLSPVS